MFRLLKWLLGLVVTLFTLILLAVIIVPMVFDPNDYRDDITKLVKEQTGRDLVLDGELDVSVFPWLGIRTNGLRLSQPEQIGGDMLKVETAQLRVKFAPLLSKQVHVDTVVLEKPEISLITLKNGIDSFHGLTEEEAADPNEPQETEDASGADAGVAIVLQGLELTGGNVLIDDRSAESTTRLSDLNFITGNLLGEDFAPLEANGQLTSSDSPDPILFDLAGLANINVDTLLVQVKDLAVDVVMGSEKINVELGSLRFSDQSKIDIKALVANVDGAFDGEVSLPSLAADLDSQQANINLVELSSGSLQASVSNLVATQFIDAPSVSANISVPPFNAAELMEELEVDYQTANPNSLKKVGVEAKLKANLDQAQISELSVLLDQSTLKGGLGVANFEKPEVSFDLVLDSLNLDDYLPPSTDEEEVESETASAGADALAVPMEVFKDLQANGQFKATQFVSGGVELNNIDVQVKSTPGKVTITPTASLYDGSIDGQIAFTDEGGVSKLSVKNEVDLVQLGGLLNAAEVTDQLSGLGTVLVDLVVTEENGVQSNNGVIKLVAKDGSIQGVDIKGMIDSAYSQYQSLSGKEPTEDAEGESSSSDETSFAEMLGTFNVNNNVITNDDFSMKAPLFRVGGSGTIDVEKQTLDYLVEVKLVASTSGQGGKSIDDLVGLPIPIRLSGDLTAPSYSIDFKQLYRSLVKREVDQKKGELLQEKFGIEGGEDLSTKSVLKGFLSNKIDKKLNKDQPAQERSLNERSDSAESDSDNDSPSDEAQTPQENSKPTKDQLKEDLKNKLLDGLFGG